MAAFPARDKDQFASHWAKKRLPATLAARSGRENLCFQGCRFGAPTCTDLVQQQLQRFRADRIRRDQLVARIDTKFGVHEVEQGRCVDYIASH
jgi:hypothetical protein